MWLSMLSNSWHPYLGYYIYYGLMYWYWDVVLTTANPIGGSHPHLIKITSQYKYVINYGCVLFNVFSCIDTSGIITLICVKVHDFFLLVCCNLVCCYSVYCNKFWWAWLTILIWIILVDYYYYHRRARIGKRVVVHTLL